MGLFGKRRKDEVLGDEVPPEGGGIVDQLQQMFPGAVINFGSDQPVAPPPPPADEADSDS